MKKKDPAITRFPSPICQKVNELSSETKKAKIEEKMREILEILGLDLTNSSVAEAPKQVAKSYVDEFFRGLDVRNFPKVTLFKEKITQQLILIKNISFISFCEHHLVPIVGIAHIAYWPDKLMLGLGNVNEVVHYFAKRPQLQERLASQIADSLSTLLDTENIAVIIHAKHFCVLARGPEAINSNSEAETHVLQGKFQSDNELRKEFFTRIGSSKHGFQVD